MLDWTTPPPGWPAAPWALLVMLAAAVAAVVAHGVVTALADYVYRRRGSTVGTAVARHVRGPTRVLVALFAAGFAADLLAQPATFLATARRLLDLGIIGALGWTAIGLIEAAVDVIELRHPIDVADNLAARRVRTQIEVLRRVAIGIVGFVTLAAALMTFPSVRTVGASLFASAGVAGLVVGIAARPAISNLIAGLQIAFTEPIRLDDVVIVEGEFGRVEQIDATYVVIRLWDDRRMVVPLAYFLEHPFENWTRSSAALTGTVYLWVDFGVPVEEMRAELERILRATELWDGRAWGLQTTDTSDRAVQIRALMTASDAGTAWNLRCHVREELVRWLRTRHPGSLPRLRAVVEEAERGDGAAGA